MNPIVPVLSGERAVALDAFNLNLFVSEGAPAGRDVAARIHARTFGTVLLDDDGRFAYDMTRGDRGFDQAVARFWTTALPLEQLIGAAYQIRAVRRPFVVLEPVRPETVAMRRTP
jgi:hypothetical protein